MNNEILQNLELFGLSNTEARVYVSVLKLQNANVSTIAKKANINRTTAYAILDKLENIGLVSKCIRNKTIVYKASSPTKLFDIINDKKTAINSIFPLLNTLYEANTRQSISFYESKEGFKTVFNMILNEAKELCIFGDGRSFYYAIPGYTSSYMKEMIKRNIRSKIILIENEHNITTAKNLYFGKDKKSELIEMRLLPKCYNVNHGGFNLFNNKTIFYSLDNQYITLLIENKTITNLIHVVFNILWNEAEKYNYIFTKN